MTPSVIKSDGIDCIVRFHDPRRLMELGRAVFSLVCQEYRPLTIIVILQRFTPEQVTAVSGLIEPMLTGADPPDLVIYNWRRSYPADARTCLLNKGLQLATRRYVMFLDYDDALYPEACRLLQSRFQQTDAAIAFASVQLLRVQVFEQFLYAQGEVIPPPFAGNGLWDLFEHNFCPLHSYLLDRSCIDEKDLLFDNSLKVEEDYDLLLRICSRYPSDFALLGTEIGYYSFKNDNSNTVAVEELTGESLSAYQQVCKQIERRRQTVIVDDRVCQQLGLAGDNQHLTIRNLLDTYLPLSGSWASGSASRTGGWHIGSLLRCLRRELPCRGGIQGVLRRCFQVYNREKMAGLRTRVLRVVGRYQQ